MYSDNNKRVVVKRIKFPTLFRNGFTRLMALRPNETRPQNDALEIEENHE